MPAWRLQDTTERFTDSCGVCAAGREHPAMASPSWSLSTPNPKLLGPGGRRWRLHLSLSGNAVPIVWLPETATRSSGHPFQNRSYCRVVLGSFPIRPPADFGLAFASNLFDWKCYNCGDVAWALRSLGAAIASVWVCVCVSVCLAGPWAVCAVPALLVLKSVGVENLESLWALLWSRNHAGSRPKVGSPRCGPCAESDVSCCITERPTPPLAPPYNLYTKAPPRHHPNTPDSTDHGASPRLHRGPSLTQRWQAQWWATLSSGTFERKFRPSFFGRHQDIGER